MQFWVKCQKKFWDHEKNFPKLSGNNYKILATLKKNFDDRVSKIYTKKFEINV